MFQLIHGRISAEIHGEQGHLEAEDRLEAEDLGAEDRHCSLGETHLSEEVAVEEVAHHHLAEVPQ